MGVMTNYLSSALVDHVLRNTAYTSPTTVYLALFTTATTKAGGGSEVTGGSYARQAITFDVGSSSGLVDQAADVTFTSMPASTLTHIGLMDALSGGNMLVYGALRSPRSIAASGTFVLDAGDLSVLFD